MTPQERPKWLRPDGTDERLVNPTAHMIGFFLNHTECLNPYAKKAKEIEETHSDFVQKILPIATQILNLDVLQRIFSPNKPTETEKRLHTQLYKTELEQVQAFVTRSYGSVEAFMDWWES